MKKLYSLIFCLGALAPNAHSQHNAAQPGTAPVADNYALNVIRDSIYEKPFFQRPMAVSLNIALLEGFGLSADVRFKPHWHVLLGANSIPINLNNRKLTVDGSSANISLHSSFTDIHATIAYSPFRGDKLRLVGGLAYVVNGKLSGSIALANPQTIGQTLIQPDKIGQLNANVDYTGISPYFGISFFKAVPKRSFDVSVDLGGYYLPNPTSTISGTKLLADNSDNTPQFNQNMQGNRFMPVFKLNFNYAINKY